MPAPAERLAPDEPTTEPSAFELLAAPVGNDTEAPRVLAKPTLRTRPATRELLRRRPSWRERLRSAWHAFAWQAYRQRSGNPLAGAITGMVLSGVASVLTTIVHIGLFAPPAGACASFAALYGVQRFFPGRRTTNGYLVGVVLGAIVGFALETLLRPSGLCRE